MGERRRREGQRRNVRVVGWVGAEMRGNRKKEREGKGQDEKIGEEGTGGNKEERGAVEE